MVVETGESGMGIFQTAGFTGDPKGVKIRYKMVQGVKRTHLETAADREGEANRGPGAQRRIPKLSFRLVPEEPGPLLFGHRFRY